MVSNTPFNDLVQNLGDYKRASAIAQNYQFFRMRYIKYKFIARYNTFQATTTEASAFPIPLFHYMIDKSGALPTATSIVQLKAEGAKPIRFTRDIVVAFKPGVSIATANANDTVLASTAHKVSPWLMTNKNPEAVGWTVNDTDHKGLYWFMETATLPADGTYEFDCEVEVCFDFKKPLLAMSTGTPAISSSAWQKAQVALGRTPQQINTPATLPVVH